MKRLILTLLCLMLICCGCSMTLMGNANQVIPYETFGTKPVIEDAGQMILYKQAMSNLAAANYEQAYRQFKELGNFQDAAEYAARFAYIPDTLLRTEQYVDGVLTKTVYASYSADGTLQTASTHGGRLVSRTTAGNGAIETEIWQYSDYILTNTYDVQTGALAKQEKRPTFSANADGKFQLGYAISYTYDENGRLLSDQGEEKQYLQTGNKITADTILFQGTYTYDESSNLILYERAYTWGGMGSSLEHYTYDEQNRLIRHTSQREGNVFFKNNDWQQTTIREYRYDDAGNRILMLQTDLSGPITGGVSEMSSSQTEYRYENGRLILETQTFGEDSDRMIETCYIYGNYLGYIYEEDSHDE